jgi:group I intron endonuclease
MFVYLVTNKINNKKYVGLTTHSDPLHQWKIHRQHYRAPSRKYASKLYPAMRKYGVEAFECEVIDQASSIEELCEKEALWIRHHRTLTEGYNILPGAKGIAHGDIPEELRAARRRGAAKANRERWSKMTEADRHELVVRIRAKYTPQDRSRKTSEFWASEAGEIAKVVRSERMRAYKATLDPEARRMQAKAGSNAAAAVNSKTYVVTDPDGNVHDVRGLAQFWRNFVQGRPDAITLYYFTAMAKKKKKSHLGWTCKEIPDSEK